MEGAAITNHGGDPGHGRTGFAADDSHVCVDEDDPPSVSAPCDTFPGNPQEADPESPSSSSEPVGERSSRDALARGISSLLGSVIKDFDLRAHQTLSSQYDLSSSIDRLTQELDRLLEDAPPPLILQHAARISSVRRRVASMNTILKSVQQRIDNIDRIVSVGLQSHPVKDSTSSRSQANDLKVLADIDKRVICESCGQGEEVSACSSTPANQANAAVWFRNGKPCSGKDGKKNICLLPLAL